MTGSRIVRLRLRDILVWPLEEVAALLQKGGVIAYPTETVYGLGVDALNEEAVKRLFQIKSRDLRKPVSVLVRDIEMLARVVSNIHPVAKPIMKRHWPGSVTIVFPASKEVPPALTGYSGNIGVRISPHPFVKGLFEFFNSPLTSTSANISGGRSLLEPEDIFRTFGRKIDLVIDMSESLGDKASTVIDVTSGSPRILRKGAVQVADFFERREEPSSGEIQDQPDDLIDN